MTPGEAGAHLARTLGARYVVLAVGLPVLVYLGYTSFGVGQPPEFVRAMSWKTYFMISMAAFGTMNAAIVSGSLVWPSRVWPGLARPIAATPRPAGSRLRVLAAVALVVPPPVIVSLAGRLEGVALGASTWLDVDLALFLGSVPFLVLGLLLRRVLVSDAGNLALVAIVVVVAILGGLFQPIETLAPALAAIAPVMPSYRLADLGWTAASTHQASATDALVLAAYTFVFGAVVVLRRQRGAPGDVR